MAPSLTSSGLVLKSDENADKSELDPRIAGSSQAEADLEAGVASKPTKCLQEKQPVDLETKDSEDPLYVEFADGDQRNPINFSRSRKWAITIHACYACLIAASTSAAFNLGFNTMTRDLNCTNFQATLGLSLFVVGFGVVPLVTSSLSEEFGRQPLYLASGIMVLLMYIAIGLAQNIQTVIVARFIQGSFASTWSTVAGGTIADIWRPHERGLPMSLFAVGALGGTGLGPLISGWIEMNPHLGWRWIQWIQMINCGAYFILLPFIMKETRSSILLRRMAIKMRKETGNMKYRARIEDEGPGLRTLIFISCTRPIHLVLTEPIVSSFSLWVGFAWGLLFCMIESISGTFQDLHNFNIGQVGTVFTTMIIGSLIGFALNFYQEKLYRQKFARRGQEGRLYMACFAGILLPLSMFTYAWCSFTFVPWYGQAIALTLFIWATYVIYTAVFTYLADCYGPFASSALAGQSLCRNIFGAVFPLFTPHMFKQLDYKWANTLFGCIATLMIPIPFTLFFYGPVIRRHSKFSRIVLNQQRSEF